MDGRSRRLVRGMLLSALLWVLVSGCAHTRARVDVVNRNLASFQIGLALYYVDNGRYPSEQEGLSVLLHSPDPDAVPYIAEIPRDPWGKPYRYRLIDNVPAVDSAGPDGVFGTDDDIRE